MNENQIELSSIEIKKISKSTYKQIKEFFKENNIILDKRTRIAYSNFCYIISKYCNKKIDYKTIIQIYDFTIDVLEGKLPNIVIEVPTNERIKWTKKIINDLNKYDLTEKEINFFAFCIIYAHFIYKNNEPCIYEFTSSKRIKEQYKYIRKEKIWSFKTKKYSNPNKEDYGYTIDNPIEVTTVSLEYAYLKEIITIDDLEITYKRIGSYQGKDNIFIDAYNIYVKNKKITTLYITPDGESNTRYTPKGFKFR